MNKIKHMLTMLDIFFSYRIRRRKCLYYPLRLWIEPTNLCNLSCEMCLNKELSKTDFGVMNIALYRKIIDELEGKVYDIYLHHRGESLLHPKLAEMISYARGKRIKTRLHTNATVLDEKRAESIIDAGLDFLSFSFDGYNREEYECIRKGANYEKTLANIRNFLKLKKKKNAKNPYVVFTVIEFGRHPVHVRREFFKQFEGLPLDAVRIRSPHNWGGHYKKINIEKNKHFIPCTFPWYSLTIFWNGDVLPCPQDFFGKLKLGNITQDSILGVWNSPDLVSVRERMNREEVSELSPCSGCDRIWRKAVFGVPVEGLKPFLRDNLFGYRE